jgi:hypothetical protein
VWEVNRPSNITETVFGIGDVETVDVRQVMSGIPYYLDILEIKIGSPVAVGRLEADGDQMHVMRASGICILVLGDGRRIRFQMTAIDGTIHVLTRPE